MKFQALVRMATTLALLYAGISVLPGNVCAQVIDFSQIDAFKSMGRGTLRGASPPKTIVDDDERHTIFMTIWEADTDAKVLLEIARRRPSSNNDHKWIGRPCIPDRWGI